MNIRLILLICLALGFHSCEQGEQVASAYHFDYTAAAAIQELEKSLKEAGIALGLPAHYAQIAFEEMDFALFTLSLNKDERLDQYLVSYNPGTKEVIDYSNIRAKKKIADAYLIKRVENNDIELNLLEINYDTFPIYSTHQIHLDKAGNIKEVLIRDILDSIFNRLPCLEQQPCAYQVQENGTQIDLQLKKGILIGSKALQLIIKSPKEIKNKYTYLEFGQEEQLFKLLGKEGSGLYLDAEIPRILLDSYPTASGHNDETISIDRVFN